MEFAQLLYTETIFTIFDTPPHSKYHPMQQILILSYISHVLHLLTKPWSFKQSPLLHNDAPNGILLAGMLESIVAPNVTLLPLKIFQLFQLIIKTMKIPGGRNNCIIPSENYRLACDTRRTYTNLSISSSISS